MSASNAVLPLSDAAPRPDRWTRLGLKMAEMIRLGSLTVVLPCGTTHRVTRTETPDATIVVRDRAAFRRLLTGGSLGLAEAYVEGLWDSPDIGRVMRLAADNDADWEKTLRGQPLMRLLSRILHHARPNSRRGARKNIISHYDLGNDFYAAWLDPAMVYSAARFETPGQKLEAAQDAKIHALCRAIGLRPGMTLLEIGCGWGRLAEIAAGAYGARVTAITLSPAQLGAARARMAAAGLDELVEVRLQDYRDVTGTFDRIASVEMFEAVGERYWGAYFRTLHDRLRPGGVAGLQTITIAENLWPTYRGNADFIQRHVFPGGMLPTPRHLVEHTRRAGLQWAGAEWFGQDYAETLAQWHARFAAAWPAISRLPGGFDTRFKRLWDYYLSYCETGFRAGWTDVGQIILAK